MKKLRMGYVGCGFMAQKVHIPNIVGMDECELVAIAEIRGDLRQSVSQRYGIGKLYDGHLALADDNDIDAVAVSAHLAIQGDIAADLLRAGKDVFMEKPIAASVEQAERILAAEKQSGRRLMIGYMKRYDPGNVLVKQLVDQFRDSGELGSIRYVRNHGFCGDWSAGLDTPLETSGEPYPPFTAAWPAWLPEQLHAGFREYINQYVHNVNLVRWLLGADAKVQVKAVDFGDDNFRGVVVLHVGGVRTVIESGAIPYHGWEEHTQVYFEKGWLKTCAPPLLLRNTPATVELYRADQPDKALTQMFPSDGRTWSYKQEMKHFVHCVQTGEPFTSPACDAAEDLRVIEAIYRHHSQTRDEP